MISETSVLSSGDVDVDDDDRLQWRALPLMVVVFHPMRDIVPLVMVVFRVNMNVGV